MATHSSILAWKKIPWTGEPGGLQSMGSMHKHRLHNHVSQFLKINLFLSVFLSLPPLLLRLPPSLYMYV